MPEYDFQPVEGNPLAPAAQPFLDAAVATQRPYIEITPHDRPHTAQATPDVLASGFAGGIAPVRSAPQAAQPFLDMAALMGQRGVDLAPLEPGYRAPRLPEPPASPEFYRTTGVSPLPAMRQNLAGVVQQMHERNRSPDPSELMWNLGGGPGGSALAIFAGPAAKTANLAALRTAEMMASQGRPREEIWSTTGWFQGADKKWRFEIPDQASRFYPAKPGQPGETLVEHQFEHPELFEAYPNLRQRTLTDYRPDDPFASSRGGRQRGAYDPETGAIALNPDLAANERRPVLLHELQHAVQREEGTAVGGSLLSPEVQKQADSIIKSRQQAANIIQDRLRRRQVEYIEGEIAKGRPSSDYTRIAMEFWNKNPHLKKSWDAAMEELMFGDRRRSEYLYDAYRRLAGEVEARNVAGRANVGPVGREAMPPWTTEDVPREQQIVRMGSPGYVQASIDKFIRAYHGSPYDFERFDLSKIGTGEGAQAYGHGLYFAENEGVAKSYKEALAGGLKIPGAAVGRSAWTVGGEEVPTGMSGHRALDTSQELENLLYLMKNNVDPAVQKVIRDNIERRIGFQESEAVSMRAKGYEPSGSAHDDMMALAKFYKERVQNAKPEDIIQKPPGRMYEVNISADPDHFLHWDKPLSEQSPKVRQVLNEIWGLPSEYAQGNMTGQDVMRTLEVTFHQPNQGHLDRGIVAQKLRDAGIPGIKYLDQGSRNAPEIASIQRSGDKFYSYDKFGAVIDEYPTLEAAKAAKTSQTHNYVVFDDKLINIVRKFGMAGMALVGAGYELVPVGDNRDPFAP